VTTMAWPPCSSDVKRHRGEEQIRRSWEPMTPGNREAGQTKGTAEGSASTVPISGPPTGGRGQLCSSAYMSGRLTQPAPT
jgi:hypothetical protein